MRWPFGRKNDQISGPVEVQEYYKAERRERTGVAWLLAIGTLIITVVLALVLFYGGRWIYRSLTNDSDTTNNDSNTSQVEQAPNTTENNGGTTQGSTNTTGQTGTSSTNTDQTISQNNSANNNSSQPATNTPAVAGTTTPVTGDSTNLPNTGSGDVLMLGVATFAASALMYYVVAAKRYNA